MASKKTYISEIPHLMKEWNWEKNTDIDPNQLTVGSEKKVWWKCSKGHEWQADIGHRNNGTGCPYCAGRKVLKGYNDLQTINPSLAKEWNYEKNGTTTPEMVSVSSGKKAWWKCTEGHEWQATIGSRNSGCGCPYCAGKKLLIGFNDLKTVNPSLAKEWNYEKNGQLSPECFTANNNKTVWWKCSKGHEWRARIANRNYGTACPYCSNKKVLKGYNDLQTRNPSLANDWNYEKNGDLRPEHFTANSNKKVWWKCNKGHEWRTSITHRSQGRGCPVCNSERKTSFPEYALAFYLKKHGLEAIHSYKENGYELDIFIPSKSVAIEYDGGVWHKSRVKQDLKKNARCKKDGIKLYRIREGLPSLNDSSVDYIVQKDQKDLPAILNKVLSKIVGKIIDVDLERDAISIDNLRELTEKENSLLIFNPKIASEWNYERNGNLRPEHFSASSNKKVWWKCSNGHEWQAVINSRNKGHRCPYCSGKYAIKGTNDLQTIKPALAEEWNYEKNNNLTPADMLPNSNKRAWWKCSQGHEWEAIIYDRVKGNGCPYCSGKKVLKGFNDLQTVNPTLAKEWNYEKNNGLMPTDITPNSHKKVWWKCSRNHEWQAVIGSRSKGRGCPYCAGQKVTKGYNDLQTINPILAKEWNFEKNNGLTPMDVSPNSNKKAWWKCSNGHEWQATIASRNAGRGCAQCYTEKRKSIK